MSEEHLAACCASWRWVGDLGADDRGGRRSSAALVFVNETARGSFDEPRPRRSRPRSRAAPRSRSRTRASPTSGPRIADALQRELLPPSLPPMPGWEVATMYEPAGEVNEVGGDFYEVFPVEGGWAVVLGDVSGKGAAAAALTAEARHTIRTAGTLAADPVAGLAFSTRNLRGRDDVALCSVAMLVLPDDDVGRTAEVLVYLAGHPHPILLRDGARRARSASPARCSAWSRSPTWTPVARRARARRPARPLHRRGDRGPPATAASASAADRLRERLGGCRGPELAVERVREGALCVRRARARGRRRAGRDPAQRPALSAARDRHRGRLARAAPPGRDDPPHRWSPQSRSRPQTRCCSSSSVAPRLA